MENKYKKFNQNFFKDVKGIVWYDRMGVYKISDDVFAEITIKTRGHADHYVGYSVEIFHKRNGSLNTNFFYFKDYLDMIHRGPNYEYYHVWDNIDFDWYISSPISVKPMTDVVMSVINRYK